MWQIDEVLASLERCPRAGVVAQWDVGRERYKYRGGEGEEAAGEGHTEGASANAAVLEISYSGSLSLTHSSFLPSACPFFSCLRSRFARGRRRGGELCIALPDRGKMAAAKLFTRNDSAREGTGFFAPSPLAP